MTTQELEGQLNRDIDQMYLVDKTITDRDYRKFIEFASNAYQTDLKWARRRDGTKTLNLEELVMDRMRKLRAKPIIT